MVTVLVSLLTKLKCNNCNKFWSIRLARSGPVVGMSQQKLLCIFICNI